MKSRKLRLGIAIGVVTLVGIVFLGRSRPIPEVKSLVGISARSWHVYEGKSPMYEYVSYEIRDKTPDEVDALISKEFHLPEGERHWMIKHPMTSIGHHEGLPPGVDLIGIGNGFADKGKIVVTVYIGRKLNWFQQEGLRLTIPQLRGKYGYATGNVPPYIPSYQRPL